MADQAGADWVAAVCVADWRAWRTESAMVVGWNSASPRSALNFIETVYETPRSSIVTP